MTHKSCFCVEAVGGEVEKKRRTIQDSEGEIQKLRKSVETQKAREGGESFFSIIQTLLLSFTHFFFIASLKK